MQLQHCYVQKEGACLQHGQCPVAQVYLRAHPTVREDMAEWRRVFAALYEASPITARYLLLVAASEVPLALDAFGLTSLKQISILLVLPKLVIRLMAACSQARPEQALPPFASEEDTVLVSEHFLDVFLFKCDQVRFSQTAWPSSNCCS
jgi:hypothetical protein